MVFELLSENASPNGAPEVSELVDALVFHARGQETGKCLDLLRRAVPNYSATDLPETRQEGLNYPPKW
jgi:hypothetical protein